MHAASCLYPHSQYGFGAGQGSELAGGCDDSVGQRRFLCGEGDTEGHEAVLPGDRHRLSVGNSFHEPTKLVVIGIVGTEEGGFAYALASGVRSQSRSVAAIVLNQSTTARNLIGCSSAGGIHPCGFDMPHGSIVEA